MKITLHTWQSGWESHWQGSSQFKFTRELIDSGLYWSNLRINVLPTISFRGYRGIWHQATVANCLQQATISTPYLQQLDQFYEQSATICKNQFATPLSSTKNIYLSATVLPVPDRWTIHINFHPCNMDLITWCPNNISPTSINFPPSAGTGPIVTKNNSYLGNKNCWHPANGVQDLGLRKLEMATV